MPQKPYPISPKYYRKFSKNYKAQITERHSGSPLLIDSHILYYKTHVKERHRG